MIEGLEQAALALQPRVGREVAWFVPADEQRLVSPELIFTFANVLVVAFLAGFEHRARESAVELGGKACEWVTKAFGNLFHGQEVKDQAKLEAAAEAAPKTAAAMPDQQFELVIRQTEKEFSLHLKGSLPDKKAEALAAEIKRVAVDYVLQPKRHQ